MKMIIMIILIIAIFIVVVAFFVNALYKRTNAYRNQFVDVRKFSAKDGVSDNLEIVNIGSNHSKYGFDYTGLDVKGENWGVGPDTFEYDYLVLRKNVSHLASGATVVISVCLLSFFLYRKKERSFYIKYYSFLEPEDIVGYSNKEKIIDYSFPIIFHPLRLRSLIKDIKKDYCFLLKENQCKTEDELKKDADFWINCWNREFDIQLPSPTLTANNRNDIIQNVRILKDMIDYCLSRGLKPVIAILPVTDYLYSRFTPEFIEKYILGYIADANKAGVPVMNYLADKRFTNPSFYINSFFFNAIGRKKFTKQFIEDLRDQSIL